MLPPNVLANEFHTSWMVSEPTATRCSVGSAWAGAACANATPLSAASIEPAAIMLRTLRFRSIVGGLNRIEVSPLLAFRT